MLQAAVQVKALPLPTWLVEAGVWGRSCNESSGFPLLLLAVRFLSRRWFRRGQTACEASLASGEVLDRCDGFPGLAG